MTRDRLAHAIHAFRDASFTSGRGALHCASVEPMGEDALTLEITRIMEHRSSTPHTPHEHTHVHWLGEMEDCAVVERYEMTLAPITDSDQIDKLDACHGPVADAATTDDKTTPTNPGAETAVHLVRRARRNRLRRRLHNAAGWAISLTVSLFLIAVAGLAMSGWPNGSTAVRQIEVRSSSVSTSLQPNLFAPGIASAAKAHRERLVSTETVATR